MIEAKDIVIKGPDGVDYKYVISKFPAIAGREIIAGYPLTAIPKIGEYKSNEEIMLKLMCYVGVRIDGQAEPLALQTRALVDNHVKSWETLMKLEWEMINYNCSFFGNGQTSSFFGYLGQKSLQWITQTLIPSLEPLLAKSKQRSKN